jgi:hypothetical protein
MGGHRNERSQGLVQGRRGGGGLRIGAKPFSKARPQDALAGPRLRSRNTLLGPLIFPLGESSHQKCQGFRRPADISRMVSLQSQ